MRPMTTVDRIRGVCRATGAASATACFHTSTPSHMRRRPRIHEKKERLPRPQVPRAWKPFEINHVLLDLDSWDSNYTRPYDAVEMQVQREKWSRDSKKDAMFKRIKKFEFELRAAYDSLDFVNNNTIWTPWQVTDVDVMTAALKGAPKDARRPTAERPYGADSHGVLSTVAFQNGIPLSTFRDDKLLLEWLFHRMMGTTQKEPGSADIARCFSSQKTVKDLCRLISTLLNSGHSLVFQNTDKIARVLSKAFQDPATQPVLIKFLPFLNSFILRCKQNGHTLGWRLCGICMKIAAQAFELRALQKYLEHGLNEGYWQGNPKAIPDVMETLSCLSQHLHRDPKVKRQARTTVSSRTPPANDSDSRVFLIHILTGSGLKNAANFRSIITSNSGNEQLRRMYRQVLDEVNAQHLQGRAIKEPRPKPLATAEDSKNEVEEKTAVKL